jgi:two-component system alkaline phosphatase synthesis response regulator PhoP
MSKMKSVLIVEDNQAMLRGLEDNFTMKGYFVKTAPDGERGLHAALAGKPDLVILDIMLPKLNGYDICTQIRRQKLDMPIIMLTAKDREDDVILGLNVGADDYVITRAGCEVKLSPGEFKMLRLFLRRAGCTLTCNEICGAVWGYSHFVTLRDIERTVARLREIIEPDPGHPTLLRTVPEIGYIFEQPEPDGNDPDY